uniref:Uncharacterized protein n=1 Tax=Calidris pygmaea TaxID=425635 RepID=A0A8C3JHC2_9CHAR
MVKPLEKLQDEARCSICLEIFQDPVSIHCGHNFCRSCITQTWEERTTNFSCPQCRMTDREVEGGENLCEEHQETWEGLTTNFSCPQCRETGDQKSLRPNREEVEGGENLCEKHQEPLKLFCKDEERLICLVCDKSKVHRDHSVERTEAAKQEIVRTYRKMHKFLEKRESSLLAQLEQLDTEITKAHEEILQRLLEETTSLGTLIGEMERTYQQPDWQLLKVRAQAVQTGWEGPP